MNFAQPQGELFGHADRAVLSSRASDGDREIATMNAVVLGNPAFQELQNVIVHPDERFLGIEKIDDFLVAAVKTPELYSPVWIGEAPHIEYEVSIGGYSVLESERLDEYGQ